MSIAALDLRHVVDLDYHTDYDCENAGCEDEGICRCSTISQTRVTGVPSHTLARRMLDERGAAEPVLRYALERVLHRIDMAGGDERWQVVVEGDYYGDEIGAVHLVDRDLIEQIDGALDELAALDDTGRVRAALTAEYGYVAPSLAALTFSAEIVDLADVTLGEHAHATRVDEQVVGRYLQRLRNEDFQVQWATSTRRRTGLTAEQAAEQVRLALGVAKAADRKVALVDGYHRIAAAREHGAEQVLLIVGR